MGKQVTKPIKLAMRAAVVGSFLTMAGGAAVADEPKRDLKITANAAITSEYVFRGFSQSAQTPTVQFGIDATYKWFYAGIWGSGLDYGSDPTRPGQDVAHVEVDFYAGIKPVLGPLTFDLGVIYYSYPNAFDPGGTARFREIDYLELKTGVSGSPWKDGTLGATLFYSPTYTFDSGAVFTLEGAVSQVLPKVGQITPTFGALIGWQTGDNALFRQLIVNNAADNYLYWNAGVTLGFGDRFSIDLRYWDTNLKDNNLAGGGVNKFCSGSSLQCDERFVATAKVTY